MKKWVLITGASSGIGLELAKIFAREGWSLVLTARNEDQLKELAKDFSAHGTETKIFATDLGNKESCEDIFKWVQRENIFIHILVNNAGFGRNEFFGDTSLPEQLDMIELNISALTHLTHLFLQPMLKRHEGKILNVASTAAFQPGPFMSVYYASKAFVYSFSYALAEEMADQGIVVTALCPGPTTTNFQKRAGRFHSEKMIKFWTMSAVEVAETGFKGLMNGKRVVIPGWLNKTAYVFSKLLPVKILAKAAGKVVRGKT
ncbi:MAG: SDR family oxidoreductase [Verrucomicrobiota bacterium]